MLEQENKDILKTVLLLSEELGKVCKEQEETRKEMKLLRETLEEYKMNKSENQLNLNISSVSMFSIDESGNFNM